MKKQLEITNLKGLNSNLYLIQLRKQWQITTKNINSPFYSI